MMHYWDQNTGKKKPWLQPGSTAAHHAQCPLAKPRLHHNQLLQLTIGNILPKHLFSTHGYVQELLLDM